MFGDFHRGDIDALRKSSTKGNLTFVVLRIILGLVAVVFTRLVGDREIKDGILGRETKIFESEDVRKRFDSGARLSECEGRIDLTGSRFAIARSSDHDT